MLHTEKSNFQSLSKSFMFISHLFYINFYFNNWIFDNDSRKKEKKSTPNEQNFCIKDDKP